MSTRPRSAVRIMDERPYRPYNSDNQPNYGSWAYQAVVSMVDLAYEHLHSRFRALEKEEPPSTGQVAKLANLLLDISTDVQREVFGYVSLSSQSHTRVRGVMRHIIDFHPVPVTTPDDGLSQEEREDRLNDWADLVEDTSVGLLKVANGIFATSAQRKDF